MYIKRYTVASLALIALIGWYVYAYVTQDTMSIDFFGIQLPALSISVWVMLPLFILYIASVLHISFYSILGSLKLRKYEKDSQKLLNAIVDAYLGKENRKYNFKTPRYTLLGSLVDNTTFIPNENISNHTANEKINTTLKLIRDIDNGNAVDLKPYNLSKDNQLVIKNNHNKYIQGSLKVDEILNNSSSYDTQLCEKAYSDFVEIAALSTILKHKEFINKSVLYKVLSRIDAQEQKIVATPEELISLFDALELTLEDYIDISKILADGMLPEDRIKLFEKLSETNEKVMDAYLYTLCDLEMNSIASEILETSQPDEHMNFKAYYSLKNSNENFSINLFV